MSITASMVKELRQRTGAGMMECKKALTETKGDLDKAVDELRKRGAATADKKASRVAAEGVVLAASSADSKTAVMIEINSETDFVARDENFRRFAEKVLTMVMAEQKSEIEEINELPIEPGSHTTIEMARKELITQIGENVQLRRVAMLHSDHSVGIYRHGDRIGVLVAINQVNPELGKDLAMHIAASKPDAINDEEVPAHLIEKEREIFTEQARQSGKPDNIIEKMIDGRIKKFLKEVSLTGQPFVKDPSKTVGELLKENHAEVMSFVCFEVGEGIEKVEGNFAEEVMGQVKGS